MFNITVDSANTRTWSSDYLDLVEGTVLLLGEYEMRLESEEYRREHDRIAASVSPNPPKDTDGRREDSGRGWVRELQGRWPGVLG